MEKNKNSAYDEFGNYFGDDDDSEESSDELSANSPNVEYEGGSNFGNEEKESSEEEEEEEEDERKSDDDEEEEKGSDKDSETVEADKTKVNKNQSNLSDLQEAFEGVEVFLEEEDTQDIEQATISKINTTVERISFIKKLDVEANRKNFDLVETNFPANTFRFEYLSKLMHQKEYIRNICIAGHFHHGKTTVVDRLIEYTRDKKMRLRKNIKSVNKNSGTVSFFTIDDEKEENFVFLKKGDIRQKIVPHNSKKDDSLVNYTDTRLDEQARGLSIKAVPISLIFQNKIYDNISNHVLLNKKKETNISYKSYVFNIIDTPGHVNFFDEFLSSINICDCCCLVVDVTDGCMYVTERVLQTCIYEDIKIILILNCLDKLILDLRLPPNDAYHKINYTIEEINMKVESICDVLHKNKQERNKFLLSPLKNNVLFSSSIYGVFFTLKSFSKIYCNIYKTFHIDIDEFSQYLWGDVYFNEEDFTFSATPIYSNQKRSFVEFILNPLYKIFGYVCSEEKEFLVPFLQNFNIKLKNREYLFSTRYLLKKINTLIFKNTTPFVDVIIDNCLSPVESAKNKLLKLYSGSLNTKISYDMLHCLSGDETDNLMIYIVKNYHRPECIVFDLFGRVMCGTIRKGQTVRILGEGYRLDDEEDMITRVVTHLWIFEGRYRVEVDEVPAGNFVLIGGVDICINKTCTITNVPKEINNKNRKKEKRIKQINYGGDDTSENIDEDEDLEKNKTAEIFFPLRKKFQYIKCASSVFKIACEPLNPSELPKMLDGLRKIDKSYPLCETKVEESGEHVILGTGELYLDCILHDLRRLYGDLEVRVSDPVVQFSETVLDTSMMNCFAETPNKKNKIHVIAEPLQKDLMEDIMQGLVYLGKDREEDLTHFSLMEKRKNNVKREDREEKDEEEENGENTDEEKAESIKKKKNISTRKGEENETFKDTDTDTKNKKKETEHNETLNYDISDSVVSILSNKYDWDLLSIRSIWTFGPENNNPNILIDDTLYKETNKANLYAIKDNIIHGFCWATREGPLMEENMKNVKVKILRAEIDDDPIKRGAGQIIPTVRRAIYSSFLLATPRILEPILFTEIICSGDCVSAVYNVLSRRRGHILKDFPKVGTPLYMVHAYIPAIESFGFETDLRTHTSGQAFCLSMFDHWHVVPGDPMDKSIVLRPLEPAPIDHLSREFMLKTRRRKGLPDDVTMNMFFDDPMLVNIKDEYAEYF